MECAHFATGRCRSCSLLPVPRVDQVADKSAHVRTLLDPLGSPEWLEPFTGPEAGFRNKAKMVAGGTVESPTLGILTPGGAGVDLRDCPLYTPRMHAALGVLAHFVTLARLVPYDLATRRGELKHVLVTEAPSGALMVRFVLRSTEPVLRIRKHLTTLLSQLREAGSPVEVVSVNLQPEHKAVLEGPDEVVLHGETLTMQVNEVGLHLRPQSFFQTNTAVAAGLYRAARAWVGELAGDAESVWDLYCGVGGFALHLATPGRRITGVEVSAEAVVSARTTATELGLDSLDFVTADATTWALAQDEAPDLVVVNPPRRGIGDDLAGWLERSETPYVLYSSCNAQSLTRDLAAMGSLRPVRAQLLDMFPQTGHYEVLVLLAR
ncbi:23S rRNA (uracil(747)-C(5))-methyltransferase RlmC [Nocardioides jishulii]|uniref:23S rRNA (Uracil(747)-C(5))-methyltransferase RlmC n=1 Tax=Nocardioides jishulii TaxID=2575440 RepID=A0A4U2YLQ0_9ACTN|nr:23S rRNA (uracil(747)-C(5))-methyltransferase RlmC [Nocardioides jishulii]TKI61850.1 23S rRNA (uracil(747)-C(5))-methyltransferase RlmC [Nocardioides jishulii]